MNLKNEKKVSRFGPGFTIASVWFCFFVGPGFASGASLLGFYASRGWVGVFIGPALSTIVAGALVYLALEYSRRHGTYDFKSFYDGVFGKFSVVFSNIKDLTIIISIFVMGALSFATGGYHLQALLDSILEIDVPISVTGLVIMLAIVLLVLAGRKIIVAMSKWVSVALMLVIIVVIFLAFPVAWPRMIEIVSNRTVFAESGTWMLGHLTLSGPAFMWFGTLIFINTVTSSVDTLIPASKGIIKTQADSRNAALLGGIGVFLSMFLMNVVLISGMPTIADASVANIPTIWAIYNIVESPAVAFVYHNVAIIAVISTLASFLYGMVVRYDKIVVKVMKKAPVKMRWTVVLLIITAVSFWFGDNGVPAIVMTGFSLLAYINLPFLEFPMLFIIFYKLKKHMDGKKSKNEAMAT